MSEAAGDVALRFLRAFWAEDMDAARALLAPDARFLFAPSLPYAREAHPGARGRDWPARDALERIVADMFTVFAPPGLSVELTSLIADGAEVAAEYIARARTVNGKDYENSYAMRMTVRDGLIASLRPYTDTRMLGLLIDV